MIEVVTAIFIMGVGMLAVLTLFPIGILTMNQAIEDDRTAHAACNAAAIAQSRAIRRDPLIASSNVFRDLFTNPSTNRRNPPNNVKDPRLQDAAGNSKSWAIYVDPIGRRSFASPQLSRWVGAQTTAIRRETVSFVGNNQAAWRWFSSLDDIVFDLEALPEKVAANRFRRASIYSWAYLLRRPKNGAQGIVNMSIVVYDERPTAMNNATQAGETVFNAFFHPNDNIVSVSWDPSAGEQPPNLGLGDWILDSTPVAVGPNKFAPSHARFYRVVGITQLSATTADLEVQQKLTDFPTPTAANPGPFPGTIVVLDGIAEVYDMGVGRHP